MGPSSAAFSTEKLERLLRGAKVTQQSIQTVSHWMLEHRSHLREMVAIWTRLLHESDANHQVVTLYIANDAMQVGARKYGKHVAEAFEPELLGVAEFIMASCDEKVKRCLLKVVGIWKERHIVAPVLLQMLQNVCAGKPAVDPGAEAAAAASADKPLDAAALCAATLQQMLRPAAIEQALDDLPEVSESTFTAATTQQLQELSSATISADLLSDRMFQLESSLSTFHAACDTFQKRRMGETIGIDTGNTGIETEMPTRVELVNSSAGDIVWEAMEPHVFELDIERSKDHVQQYRDALEAQSATRDALLTYLTDLEHAELFPEPQFAATGTSDVQVAQCEALEQLFTICFDAEAIEKQRDADAHATAAAANSRNSFGSPRQHHRHHHSGASSSSSSSRASPAALQRRHSSYDDRYHHSKRPKLEHAHSSESSSSRYEQLSNRRQSEPVLEPSSDYGRKTSSYREENRYSPRSDATDRYHQQPDPPAYHPREHAPLRQYESSSSSSAHRSSSRWEARPPPPPPPIDYSSHTDDHQRYSNDSRDRRW